MKILYTDKNNEEHIVFVNFEVLHDTITDIFRNDDNMPRLGIFCRLEFQTDNRFDSIIYGKSVCAPMDKFDRSKGRMLALSRAMRTARLSRNERVQIVNGIRAKGCKLWGKAEKVSKNA
jgi:hypothetical protein